MTKIMIGLYSTPHGGHAYCTMYFNTMLSAQAAFDRAHAKIKSGYAHNRDYLLNCLTLGNFKVESE